MPGFKRNFLFLVVLEKKGIRYSYVGDERHLVRRCGTKIAELTSEGHVLILRGEFSGALANAVMVHSVVQNQEHVGEAVHKDTLYNWHMRFGHQSYDAIEPLVAKPGSGIKLTDKERPNCMICAEGKQTKDMQSKKNSGENSLIDTGSME